MRHDSFTGAVFIDEDMVGLAVRRTRPEIEGLHAGNVGCGEPEGERRIKEDVVWGKCRWIS